MKVTEDDLYRQSTQFKYWSFTSAQLAAQRIKTNIQATERVKANVARQRAQRLQQAETDSLSSGVENGSGANTPLPDRGSDVKEVECLTADEELMIVDEFCERTLALGAHCNFPTEITATCIQFLRRFYLYNSPMTYHGQNISRTAMFLAAKVENGYIPADQFATNFAKTTAEQILAPEYLVVQGIRFQFDVKHPFRAMKGGNLELVEMSRGSYDGPNNMEDCEASADLQAKMLRLPRKAGEPPRTATLGEMENRLNKAYASTMHVLRNTACLTDAYFFYTPSQIWLASLLLADEPLAHFYITVKLPSTSPILPKLFATLRACAKLLSSHRTYIPNRPDDIDAKHKAQVKLVINKLKSCRDPDKVDLVKLNQAQKRDAVTDKGDLDEHKAKRRKVERETYEKESESFWGPELGKA